MDILTNNHEKANQRSYRIKAAEIFLLYFVFWLPGAIFNFIYVRKAYRDRRQSGHTPKGTFLLTGELVVLTLLPLLITVFGCLLIQRLEVSGNAMSPTLRDGDQFYSSKLSPVERGAIILYDPYSGARHGSVMRAVAVGGDVVSMQNQHLTVNGRVVVEPYVPVNERAAYTLDPYTVPRNDVFVLGDNRNMSYDSHSTYPPFSVPRSSIHGVLWFISLRASR